jgi:hypothetical protein
VRSAAAASRRIRPSREGRRLVVEQSVARTREISDPAPGFDVAAFERRIWGELAEPY